MPDPTPPPLTLFDKAVRLLGIAAVLAVAVAAFAYVSGRLDPERLKPRDLVNALQTNNGVHPGYRRNHAKGVCVIGYFEGNGQLQGLSSSPVFAQGRTPVVGRFALPSGNPYAPDTSVPLRSFALRFSLANGQQWRTGMNSMPVFPVGTPQAFYAMLKAGTPDPATGKPKPDAMPAFFASHPETAPFLAWVKGAKPSASYATQTYNSINAFYLDNADGQRQAVRWAVVPDATDSTPAGPDAGADFLQADLAQRLAGGPLRWTLRMTLAEPGDPVDDASKAWPAGRKTIDAGTLVVERMQPQITGQCRDINYDPTILPSGIEASNDPLLAARSAAYASSYLRRTSEVDQLSASAPAGEAKP